jgi:hypothetical protein
LPAAGQPDVWQLNRSLAEKENCGLERERVRLPFPERVPLRYAIIFAALLCTAQVIQGTDLLFSLFFFLFVILTAITFNLAGGLTRPSGGYVFFYSLLAVIVGVFWKACIGERADSNLLQPMVTMGAILCGMIGMLVAVYISRKLTRKRPILGSLDIENMGQAAIGCMITGLILTAIFSLLPIEGGSVLSALGQLNGFLPLAMMLAVIYEIRRSGGTRSVNLTVLLSGGVMLAQGLIGFSKQGIFTPLLCWALAAASQRYKVTLYQAICLVLAGAFMVYYLVPYSQYGRNFRVFASTAEESGTPVSAGQAFLGNLDASVTLLSQLGYVRQQYELATTGRQGRIDDIPAYFDTPQGFFDRLQMVSIDDAIINVTEQRGPFGLWPIVYDFENFVPRVLWPGKPTIGIGNMYAHEIGMIAPDDLTTGISFSPIGEAFHIARWVGVLLIAPILWIMLFVLFDSLCGDIREYPWGLFILVVFGHVAPEGGFGSLIHMYWIGTIAVTFAALAAIYVMPLLGYIATGTKGARLRSVPTVQSIPRRLPPIRPSENSGQ